MDERGEKLHLKFRQVSLWFILLESSWNKSWWIYLQFYINWNPETIPTSSYRWRNKEGAGKYEEVPPSLGKEITWNISPVCSFVLIPPLWTKITPPPLHSAILDEDKFEELDLLKNHVMLSANYMSSLQLLWRFMVYEREREAVCFFFVMSINCIKIWELRV